jgi:sugar phosphate isomerase/epimerase
MSVRLCYSRRRRPQTLASESQTPILFHERDTFTMNVGVSSYSFSQSFRRSEMDILDAIDWVAASAAAHVEITSVGLVATVATLERAAPAGSWDPADYPDRNANIAADLANQPALIAAIRDHAGAQGVPLSNYAVGANFRADDLAGEIARVKQHIDAAHALGIRHFRHDVVAWSWREESQAEFEGVFDTLVQASRELADYAAPLGITTSIENHGFCMNLSERVRRLITTVDRPNFRTTLDIGNFLCVDEEPESAVPLNLPYASVVHLKDFYHRQFLPGDGWLTTLAGNAIQGSIVGFGDLPMKRLLAAVKASGFDGPISIEYEGQVPDLFAIETGLANAKRIWNEI